MFTRIRSICLILLMASFLLVPLQAKGMVTEIVAFWYFKDDVKNFLTDVNDNIMEIYAATGDEKAKALLTLKKAKENLQKYEDTMNAFQLSKVMGTCSSSAYDYNNWKVLCGDVVATFTNDLLSSGKLTLQANKELRSNITEYNKYKDSTAKTKAINAINGIISDYSNVKQNMDGTMTILTKAEKDITEQVAAEKTNTGKDKLVVTPFTSRIFPNPTGCSYATQPLKCWTSQLFSFASIAVGSIGVIAIMVGGVLYMTSGGNPDRTKMAKTIMFNALAGIAIIILANWFFRSVLGTTWGL